MKMEKMQARQFIPARLRKFVVSQDQSFKDSTTRLSWKDKHFKRHKKKLLLNVKPRKKHEQRLQKHLEKILKAIRRAVFQIKK